MIESNIVSLEFLKIKNKKTQQNIKLSEERTRIKRAPKSCGKGQHKGTSRKRNSTKGFSRIKNY